MKGLLLLLFLLSFSSFGSCQIQDSTEVSSLTLESNYQALFDTTQTEKIFLENLLKFRNDLKEVESVDTVFMLFANPNSSRKMVYLQDSLIFECSTSSSWSGSWSNTSRTLFYRGKLIYTQFSDFTGLNQVYVQTESHGAVSSHVGTRQFEFYNFWSGIKVSYQYQYTMDPNEMDFLTSEFENILHLNENISIERITMLKFEPIEEDHRLNWYFQNDLKH